MTLKELYSRAKGQPKPETPATVFIREVADVTKKSEISVRRWISEDVVPDALTQEVLAKHFDTTASELFPGSITQSTNQRKNPRS